MQKFHLAAVGALTLALSGCALTPEPLTDLEVGTYVADKRARVTANQEPLTGALTLDGQDDIQLQPEDVVRVRRAPFDVELVRLSHGTFYQRLRTKLRWGAAR